MNGDDLLKKFGVEMPNLKEQLKELSSINYERTFAQNFNVKPITEDPAFRRAIEEKHRKETEREEREIVRTQNSTKSVELLEEAVALQKQTIEGLNTKIDTASHTLDLILNSLGANSQKTQQELIENRRLLVDLKTYIETDKSGYSVKKFIDKHGIESIGLIVQLISMILSPGTK